MYNTPNTAFPFQIRFHQVQRRVRYEFYSYDVTNEPSNKLGLYRVYTIGTGKTVT